MKTPALVSLLLLLLTVFVLAETPVEKDNLPIVTDTLVVKIDSLKTGQHEELTDKVIVYYFHGTRRCSNCIKFEE